MSSLTACAAVLGEPLASRDDRLGIVPATLDEADLKAAIAPADAVAVIKVGRHLPKLKRVLAELELTDRARYVERATMPSQRIRPLAEVPVAELDLEPGTYEVQAIPSNFPALVSAKQNITIPPQ